MPSRIPEIQFTLASWFASDARDLPWRHPTTTPWGVLVSEIMLQQTPASRVAGPWMKWMEQWPTPATLARAPRADMLRAWGRSVPGDMVGSRVATSTAADRRARPDRAGST